MNRVPFSSKDFELTPLGRFVIQSKDWRMTETKLYSEFLRMYFAPGSDGDLKLEYVGTYRKKWKARVRRLFNGWFMIYHLHYDKNLPVLPTRNGRSNMARLFEDLMGASIQAYIQENGINAQIVHVDGSISDIDFLIEVRNRRFIGVQCKHWLFLWKSYKLTGQMIRKENDKRGIGTSAAHLRKVGKDLSKNFPGKFILAYSRHYEQDSWKKRQKSRLKKLEEFWHLLYLCKPRKWKREKDNYWRLDLKQMEKTLGKLL